MKSHTDERKEEGSARDAINETLEWACRGGDAPLVEMLCSRFGVDVRAKRYDSRR